MIPDFAVLRRIGLGELQWRHVRAVKLNSRYQSYLCRRRAMCYSRRERAAHQTVDSFFAAVFRGVFLTKGQ